MILVDTNGLVLASADLIERVDEFGEENIIKVTREDSYFYIATEDRDSYVIYDNIYTPTDTENYTYINGIFSMFVNTVD